MAVITIGIQVFSAGSETVCVFQDLDTIAGSLNAMSTHKTQLLYTSTLSSINYTVTNEPPGINLQIYLPCLSLLVLNMRDPITYKTNLYS